MIKTLKRPLRRRSFLAGTGAVAAGLTLRPRWGHAAEEPRVNFYNWDTYIGETTLEDFQAATGIAATMDLFADNDELFAKLKEGNPGYDLIVPTNDYAERMILAGMLVPLDHSLIPNLKNVAPSFQDAAFDPGRKYTMPYMWGTIGIGYRVSAVGDELPTSWRYVFESDKHSGRIALLSEATTMIGLALKYLGYSYNSIDPKEIGEAEALIIKQKPHIKVFAEDNGQDLLLAEEVDLCVEWNGDMLQVMSEDDDLNYLVPEEGSYLWQDTLAIPTGAPHPMNAHALINFILDAEAGAAIAEFIQYATPNGAAREIMSEDYRNNPAIFPTDEIIAKSEPGLYLGEDRVRLINDAWTRILAA
jgi:spermidine/putrescine transport system substrate-binding protein